jgi:4-amino-4-deoxy-L-arabinose transferase-like glycosyltransferase
VNAPARQPPPWSESAALLLILGLALYPRFANLAHNPGWYTDEGTHLAIASQLQHGRVQYLAITQSTLLFARLPLFEIVLAGLMRLGGEGMGTLRALTASLGAVSVVLVHMVVRRASRDGGLALIAAVAFALYPQAVLYSRFGFSYNLLTPFALLAYIGLWKYASLAGRGWLALAALAVGTGSLSDLAMAVFIAPLAIVVLIRQPRDLLWGLPLAALPFGGYAALMLAAAPQAFLFDLAFTLARLNSISFSQQLAVLSDNYLTLLSQDRWMAAGLLGLLFLRPARLRWFSLLFFLIPLTLLGRTAALYGLTYYYVIPLLPFVALGVAALIRFCAQHTWEWLEHRAGQRLAAGAAVAIGCVVAAPFLFSAAHNLDSVRSGYVTVIDDFLIDPSAAERVAAFVNARTGADDLVIASPSIAWMFAAPAADFQMAVAATGRATVHLPAGLPADRYAFDPRYTRARFVVVDNLWRNWAVVHMPAVAEMVRAVEAWPLALEVGQVEVYRNPAHAAQ